MSDRFAPLPEPPYYAVIFTSRLRDPAPGYGQMAGEMMRLAEGMPGYIGAESARDGEGLGITVSYWQDEAAIAAWRGRAEHLVAQKLGKTRWYAQYRLRVARVERAYDGP